MKKIITSTVVFLSIAYSLSAQDSVGQGSQYKPSPSTTTYSAQKPSVAPMSSASTGFNKSATGGVPATAQFLTMDLSEVYSKYTKAVEAQEKFDQAEENARKEITEMYQDGIKLGDAYKELVAKANNPALSEEAKKKFNLEAEGKVKEIEEKQMQISQYQQQANQTLMQRKQSVTNLHLSDMKEVCAKIAKEKGANLVLNTTGIGVMYHDGSTDITSEVIETLNSTKK